MYIINYYLNNIVVNDDEMKKIFIQTIKQSQSKTWVEQRKIRISATKTHQVINTRFWYLETMSPSQSAPPISALLKSPSAATGSAPRARKRPPVSRLPISDHIFLVCRCPSFKFQLFLFAIPEFLCDLASVNCFLFVGSPFPTTYSIFTSREQTLMLTCIVRVILVWHCDVIAERRF